MSETKITLSGSEYTFKDVTVLRTKMLASKLLGSIKLEDILTWIGDEKKEKEAIDGFNKFLSTVLDEPYTGKDVLSLHESEVVAVTSLFFELATANPTPMSKE